MEAVIATLGVILFVAFLTESLTEYLLGTVFAKVPAISPFSWVLMYAAGGVGVALAFYYGFDLIYLLDAFLGSSTAVPAVPGKILTGLAIGRGAGYIHDIVMTYFPSKSGLTPE